MSRIGARFPILSLGMTSLLDYVSDIEREIKSFGEPVIVAGHSMGGLIAQILASRMKIEALVLLSTAPPAGIFSLNPSTVKCFLSSFLLSHIHDYALSMENIILKTCRRLFSRMQASLSDEETLTQSASQRS